MNAALDEATQLFKAGCRDRTSFQLLIETGRAPNETIGFLAQQACEKFIKAILVIQSVPVERTHDLERLSNIANAAGLILPVPASELRQLNPYAVALRYEGIEVGWVTDSKSQTMVDKLYAGALAVLAQQDTDLADRARGSV
jgi:HEPN domain-containing protein